MEFTILKKHEKLFNETLKNIEQNYGSLINIREISRTDLKNKYLKMELHDHEIKDISEWDLDRLKNISLLD